MTDTHYGARNDNIKVAEHQKRFYDEVFFPYLIKNNITDIIHLGDVFDRRKYISFTSLRAAKEMFFQPTWEHRLNVHMLVGNHDSVYRNTLELNSVNLLCKEYPNITEYCSPETLTLSDGTPILMVPWICKDNEGELTEEMSITPAQIVMGHLELSGFQMNKGFVVQEGFDHRMFSAFDMVCTGHYHHKSSDGNIHYLGAPYEMTWMDHDDERGFHIFDTETRELTRVVNPLKLFHKIWYDDTNMQFDDLVKKDFSYCKDSFIKVIISNKTNPYMFDTFVSKIEEHGPINMQVVEDHLNLDLDDDEDIIDEAEDTLTILNGYVEGLEITADKEKVKTVMRTLYDEAMSVV